MYSAPSAYSNFLCAYTFQPYNFIFFVVDDVAAAIIVSSSRFRFLFAIQRSSERSTKKIYYKTIRDRGEVLENLKRPNESCVLYQHRSEQTNSLIFNRTY